VAGHADVRREQPFGERASSRREGAAVAEGTRGTSECPATIHPCCIAHSAFARASRPRTSGRAVRATSERRRLVRGARRCGRTFRCPARAAVRRCGTTVEKGARGSSECPATIYPCCIAHSAFARASRPRTSGRAVRAAPSYGERSPPLWPDMLPAQCRRSGSARARGEREQRSRKAPAGHRNVPPQYIQAPGSQASGSRLLTPRLPLGVRKSPTRRC
jgi:hypothetical protein